MGGGGGVVFFFNDTATTEIYTLSLHDALPIYQPISLGEVGQFLSSDFSTIVHQSLKILPVILLPKSHEGGKMRWKKIQRHKS